MAHVLLPLVMLGAFIILRTGLSGRRRTITPRAIPEAQPEWRGFAPVEDDDDEPIYEAREPVDDAPAAPVAQATPTGRPSYLLGARPAGAAPDRMAAAMAMMAGPGICTPPDG